MSAVDHPDHYNQVPGIECIDVVEHLSFLRGNAIKYLWRAGSKGDLVQDLEKAKWYIQREIDNARRAAAPPASPTPVQNHGSIDPYKAHPQAFPPMKPVQSRVT